MKRFLYFAFAVIFFSFAVTACKDNGLQDEQPDAIAANFATTPPREAYPWVWWHWMDGNISKDGIRKDLLWMDRIGISGLQLFDAGMKVPQIVPERILYMSD